MKLHTYRCDACGEVAVWRPAKQEVMCRSCSTIVPLPPADPTPAASFLLVRYLRDTPENRRKFTPARLELPCPTCSHVVVFEAAIEATTCEACLTPLLRPPDAQDMPIRPTGVIPFRIDEADARERLRAWWRDLRGSDPRTRHLEADALVARYVPFWQFSVHVNCPWRCTIKNDDGPDEVRKGEVKGDYGEREPGNHSLPGDLLNTLPFAFEQAVAYDRRYLAGAIVEQYDTDMFTPWDAARWRIDSLVESLVRKEAGWFGDLEHWPNWSNEKGWLILAPFYTTSIDFRGERHHIIIDGHSGQIASTVPLHLSLAAKLVMAAVLAALIAFVWWVISKLIA